MRFLILILIVTSSAEAFSAKIGSLTGQELSNKLYSLAGTYLDSVVNVYLNGPESEKLNAAMPLWCAFNQKMWWKKTPSDNLSKIDTAQLNSFIETEISKETQLEKRIDFLLLKRPYSWLEQKVAIGKLDTNLFNTAQKAQLYYKLGGGFVRNDNDSFEKIIYNYKKAIHHSKECIGLKPIFTFISGYLGTYYFDKGEIEKALSHYNKAIEVTQHFTLGKVEYLPSFGLHQRWFEYPINLLVDAGMAYGKLGSIVEEINLYKLALGQLKFSRRPVDDKKYWIKSLMINSYFDLGNTIRAKKLLTEYLADLNENKTIERRENFYIFLIRELNYYDIGNSAEILDSLFYSMPFNYKHFEPDSVIKSPVDFAYSQRAILISIKAIIKGFDGNKLDVPGVIVDIEKLIDLHTNNIETSNSKNKSLNSLICLKLAWQMALQNDKNATASQNRLKALFANEDSLYYFSYYAKLTTYLLKLHGKHAEEIELLHLLESRYKKGSYITELQELYFQLSEAYGAIGNANKSLAYYISSDSLKQQTQQLNQQAQLAMFDKELEVSKTIIEKKLLETENEALKMRRNALIVVVVLVSLVAGLIALLFYINRKKNKLIANQKLMQLQLLQKDVEDKNDQLENTALQLLKSNSSFAKLFDEMNHLTTSLNTDVKQKARSALLNHKALVEDDIWEQFRIQFERTHTSFFSRLKAFNKDLTESELRICAMHVSKLTNKEVAAISGQQINSIYTLKSRIRKKLNVQNDDELLERLKKTTLL